jgi:hypothetical protein
MNRTAKRLERPDLMAKQILRLYKAASPDEFNEGTLWYEQAHEICKLISLKYSCPLPKVAGVMAALSPATNWQQNVADAHNLILAWHHGLSPNEVVCTTYGPNKLKAVRILNLESNNERDVEKILLHKSKINKTTCFYLNILHPSNDEQITVDRHAIRIALGNAPGVDNICMTEKRYRNIAESYQIAASQLEISAINLQAVVWCAYRRMAQISASNMENEIFTSIINQI